MRILAALACLALLSAASVPAPALTCTGGRCPLFHRDRAPLPYGAGHTFLVRRCCCTRAGWGWYLRQKLRHDCSAPLVIVDELGGVTLRHAR